MIIILSFLAAICNVIMDEIAHYDNYKTWGYWWSQDAYYNAKYVFAKKHNEVPKWFINSVLIVFLDAWHFCKLLMIVLFFTIIGIYSDWLIALFGFIIYQLTFLIYYGKKT